MSKFCPDPAQISFPRRPQGHPPRARRNASKSNACPGRVLHAVTALPPLLRMCWCSISRWDSQKGSPLRHSLASTSSSTPCSPSSSSQQVFEYAPPWPWPTSRARAPAAAGCSRPRPGPGVAMASRGQAASLLPPDALQQDPMPAMSLPPLFGEGRREGTSGYNIKQLRVPDAKP